MVELKKDGMQLSSHATQKEAEEAGWAEARRMSAAKPAETGPLSVEDTTGKTVWTTTVNRRVDVR
jgi:hypothetical protein